MVFTLVPLERGMFALSFQESLSQLSWVCSSGKISHFHCKMPCPSLDSGLTNWCDFAGVTDDEGNGDSETEENIIDNSGLTNRCDCAGVTDDEGSGDSESEEEIVDENGVTRRVKKRKGGFPQRVVGGRHFVLSIFMLYSPCIPINFIFKKHLINTNGSCMVYMRNFLLKNWTWQHTHNSPPPKIEG